MYYSLVKLDTVLIVRVPEALALLLDREARRRRTTRSDIVREVLLRRFGTRVRLRGA